MPPKSVKLRHYSLSWQNSVKFCKDFTPDRIFLHQHCWHVGTFLHLWSDVPSQQTDDSSCCPHQTSLSSGFVNLLATFPRIEKDAIMLRIIIWFVPFPCILNRPGVAGAVYVSRVTCHMSKKKNYILIFFLFLFFYVKKIWTKWWS